MKPSELAYFAVINHTKTNYRGETVFNITTYKDKTIDLINENGVLMLPANVAGVRIPYCVEMC